ncbi:thiosulfate sulfurtransferase-like [Bufo gargarizans]|uniref:thiosulfate sulfurtransferase-like n=1 Tax=Bufo gargarizans TaxID=30331 RepID=UPI001CF53DE2|nr:thiosulfate sulfurtransferase-like [Bufo gargarizans]
MVSRALISAGWLSEVLKARRAPALRVLDATWYSPGSRDAKKEYEERHIPGASFFDLEQCKDQQSPYEMMLPTKSQFAKYAGELGISNESHVVVYDCDNLGMLYAPRLWWMFRVFGHHNVSLLNGGLTNWMKQGFPVTSEATRVTPETFRVTLNQSLLKSFEDIQENISSKRFQLVDTRSKGNFQGPEPKPGEGIEPGHIPGSVNIPFSNFLTKDGYEKPVHEIHQLFQDRGIDLTKPLTATCRCGVTACHLALASFLLGKDDTAVYDGSWSEWFHRAKPEHKVFERRNRA